MENIRIRDIVEAVNGRLLCGDMETSLRHISIDSRTMKGDDLFVPLIGEKRMPTVFKPGVRKRRAVASLTSEHDTCPEGITGALIRVEDTKGPSGHWPLYQKPPFPAPGRNHRKRGQDDDEGDDSRRPFSRIQNLQDTCQSQQPGGSSDYNFRYFGGR